MSQRSCSNIAPEWPIYSPTFHLVPRDGWNHRGLDFEVSQASDYVLLTCSSPVWGSTRNVQIFCCDIHPLHVSVGFWTTACDHQHLEGSLFVLQFVANPCQKRRKKESNLFSLKLVSLWSKEKQWKDFFSLRHHETLLLYSINYLLSCYISIPRACWRILWYFSKNI